LNRATTDIGYANWPHLRIAVDDYQRARQQIRLLSFAYSQLFDRHQEKPASVETTSNLTVDAENSVDGTTTDNLSQVILSINSFAGIDFLYGSLERVG